MTTPSLKAVNPELVKAAAEMAEPRAWFVSDRVGCVGSIITRIDDSDDENEMPVFKEFDPISYPSDAHALMLALMKEGYSFHYYETDNTFFSMRYGNSHTIRHDASFPILLLRCVSAMKGIDLYA